MSTMRNVSRRVRLTLLPLAIALLAAGLSGRPINHEEVLETARAMNADIGMLLQRFFEIYEQ